MYLRSYTPKDCEEIISLFYNTVHCINCKDYTKEQLLVWAPNTIDPSTWNRSFLEHQTLVAIEEEQIVGFADLEEPNYLDRLYVHKDYQNRGIATLLCDKLEQTACSYKATDIETHASITARPFFEHRGYIVQKEQQVNRQGILLTNYVMRKNF